MMMHNEKAMANTANTAVSTTMVTEEKNELFFLHRERMSSRTGDQIDFTIYHCETPFVGMGSCADVGFGGPATGALPEGWIEKLDVVSGRLFYFHEKHPTFFDLGSSGRSSALRPNQGRGSVVSLRQ